MKKLAISFATCLYLASTPASASGIPTVDIAAIAQNILQYQQMIEDYAMQVKQYQNMYEQLQQQVQMVEMQIRNLKNIANYNWSDLRGILNSTRRVMSQVKGLSYDVGGVAGQFENIYGDMSKYSKQLGFGLPQLDRNQFYTSKINEIADTNQNTLNGTLQKLEIYYNQLEDEAKTLNDLNSRVANSKGNLEVLQATGDLLAYSVDETRKLRSVLMDQSNAMLNYQSALNNEKILGQARDAAISNKANRTNPFEATKDAPMPKFR